MLESRTATRSPGPSFFAFNRKESALVCYTQLAQQTDLPQRSKGMSKSIVGQMC